MLSPSPLSQLGYGTHGLDKIDPRLSEARGKFLTDKTLKGTRKAHASDKLAHLPDGSPPLRCLQPCAMWSAHSSVKLPSPSLRSARVLTGLYSAFSNPVLERLGYGMANMRLISRDAAERNASRPTGRWGQLFRCCTNASAGTLLRRRSRWTQ